MEQWGRGLGTAVFSRALSPLAETRPEPSQSSGKANNPGVNLVLSWEANGTQVENRREEAKQLVI